MLAAHVAVQADLAGDGPVAVLDADPAQALMAWWTRRAGRVKAPAVAEFADFANLEAGLDRLRAQGMRLCVVDTPATDANALDPVFDSADLVVIPCDADKDGVEKASALAGRAAGRATVAFVINGRSHSGEATGNALASISGGGGWPAGMVRHADGYPMAMTGGRTVMETHPGLYAGADIAALWASLRGILAAG